MVFWVLRDNSYLKYTTHESKKIHQSNSYRARESTGRVILYIVVLKTIKGTGTLGNDGTLFFFFLTHTKQTLEQSTSPTILSSE